MAKRLKSDNREHFDLVEASQLKRGDRVVVEANDFIPADGEVIEGVASVNESAVTGESAPVLREAGGDFSSVTGGTRVLSDWLVVRVTSLEGEGFLDRMIAMVEGAKRRKTPNEIALTIMLAMLTLVFLLATVTLAPFTQYAVTASGQGSPVIADRPDRAPRLPDPDHDRRAALRDRHRRHGSHGAGERHRDFRPRGRGGRRRRCAAARQDRHDHARRPPGRDIPRRCPAPSRRSSRTPRSSPRSPTRRRKAARSWCSRSMRFQMRGRDLTTTPHTFHKFSAHTRMSGVDLDGRRVRKGAADAVRKFVEESGGAWPAAASEHRADHRAQGRDAAGRRRRRSRAGRHRAPGRRQGRHQGALRPAAPHGHQDRHGHRRQPPDRRGDRGGGRRRRFPRGSDAGGEARAHPQEPGRGPHGRDVRRRHQRRAGARAGGRRASR